MVVSSWFYHPTIVGEICDSGNDNDTAVVIVRAAADRQKQNASVVGFNLKIPP